MKSLFILPILSVNNVSESEKVVVDLDVMSLEVEAMNYPNRLVIDALFVASGKNLLCFDYIVTSLKKKRLF